MSIYIKLSWLLIAIFAIVNTSSTAMAEDLDSASLVPGSAPQKSKEAGTAKTGTIFQILSIGPRIGLFRSVTWDDETKNWVRKMHTVDAGLGGDVQGLVIARIIAVIREDHGDTVKWDSVRLGRTVLISIRKEDDVELKRFLTAEFFGLENSSPH